MKKMQPFLTFFKRQEIFYKKIKKGHTLLKAFMYNAL